MAFGRRPITTEAQLHYHARPFVVEGVTQGSVFLGVLHFFLISRSSRIPHTRSLICDGRCIISETDNVIELFTSSDLLAKLYIGLCP